MRFRLLIAALALSCVQLSLLPARAQDWYWWCDASNAGYPWVRTCATPWRLVYPSAQPPQAQGPNYQATPPAPVNLHNPVLSGATVPDSSAAPAAPPPSTASQEGQAARQAWESWFSLQSGDFHAGAEWWAAHRSLPHPGSCTATPPSTGEKWTAGCLAAQQRLAAADVRRRTEPEYRRGWNSFASVAGALGVPSEASPGTPPYLGSQEGGPASYMGVRGNAGALGKTAAAPEGLRPEVAREQLAGAGEESEKQFIATIEEFAAHYNEAANEMAQGAVRPERARALCELLPLGIVRDWVGTVAALSSTNDGRGILVVRISPHVTLGTTNNSLSEALSPEKTLIPTDSPLFKQVAALKEGQSVVFSGQLSRGDDCFAEMSLTVTGAMTEPEFTIRFTAVQPASSM